MEWLNMHNGLTCCIWILATGILPLYQQPSYSLCSRLSFIVLLSTLYEQQYIEIATQHMRVINDLAIMTMSIVQMMLDSGRIESFLQLFWGLIKIWLIQLHSCIPQKLGWTCARKCPRLHHFHMRIARVMNSTLPENLFSFQCVTKSQSIGPSTPFILLALISHTV